MDLPTNYFITRDVNYVCNYKNFTKGVMVFKIALIVAAVGSNIL